MIKRHSYTSWVNHCRRHGLAGVLICLALIGTQNWAYEGTPATTYLDGCTFEGEFGRKGEKTGTRERIIGRGEKIEFSWATKQGFAACSFDPFSSETSGDQNNDDFWCETRSQKEDGSRLVLRIWVHNRQELEGSVRVEKNDKIEEYWIKATTVAAAALDAELQAGQKLIKDLKLAPDFSKTFYAQITTTIKMQGCGSITFKAKKGEKGILLEEEMQGFSNDVKLHIVSQRSVVSDAEFNALEYAENTDIQMADGQRKISCKLTFHDHKLTKLSIAEGKETTTYYSLVLKEDFVWNISEPIILQLLDCSKNESFALREINTMAFGPEGKEMDVGSVKILPPPRPSQIDIWRFKVIRHEDGSFEVDVSRAGKEAERRYEFDKSGALTKIFVFFLFPEGPKLVSETNIINKEQFEQAKAKLEAEKILPPSENKPPPDKWQDD